MFRKAPCFEMVLFYTIKIKEMKYMGKFGMAAPFTQ